MIYWSYTEAKCQLDKIVECHVYVSPYFGFTTNFENNLAIWVSLKSDFGGE